ncbi:hypothetical protein [Methanoculleus chikugoensis]|uniref:hypothetical protein n=1 Tax=Methanoculleus chikugoensis TaxID=118126 RepID=UPI0006CFA456|nr:hypothetical protein [Methanoculleus chikugoensis]
MPRKIGALVCLALAIIVGCVWVLGPGQVPESPLPARAGAGEDRYSLNAEFPEVRDSYTLYRAVPVTVTEEQVREVAERFGLAGEPGTMNKKTGEFLLIDARRTRRSRYRCMHIPAPWPTTSLIWNCRPK